MNSYCMQHIMQFLFPSRDRHVCAQKSTHEVHTVDMFGYKDAPVLAVGCGVSNIFLTVGGGSGVRRGPDAALICVRDHIHVPRVQNHINIPCP